MGYGNRGKIFLFFLLGCLLTIPFPPEYNNPFIAGLIISFFFLRKEEGALITSIREPWVLLNFALFLLYLLGMLYTEESASGWSQVETKLGMLVFPFVLFGARKISSGERNFLLLAFTALLLILSLICLGNGIGRYLDTGNSAFLVYNKLVKPVSIQPIYFSLFLLFVLIVGQSLLIEKFEDLSNAQRAILIIISFYLVLFLFLLSSRTSIAAFALWAGLRTIFFLAKKHQRFLVIVLFSFEVLVGGLALTQLEVNKLRFQEAIDPNSNYQTDTFAGRSLRIEKWKCSIGLIKDNFLIGVGTGDEDAEMLKCFKAKGIEEGVKWKYNSHNQYLSSFVQVGVSGFIFLIAILLIPIWEAYKQKRIDLFGLGLMFAMVIGTETMLSRRWGVLFMTLILSVWIIKRIPRTARGSEEREK